MSRCLPKNKVSHYQNGKAFFRMKGFVGALLIAAVPVVEYNLLFVSVMVVLFTYANYRHSIRIDNTL